MPFIQTENTLHFEFPYGLLRGTRWEVGGDVCLTPTCADKELDLRLRPVSETSTPSTVEREFCVDLGTRRLAAGGSEDDRFFGEVLLAQLEPEDWGLLESMFSSAKDELYESTALTELEYEFPVAEIETKGLLISYNSVLPFHNEPRFEVEGTRFLAVDQYALGSGFQALGPVITFHAIEPRGEGEPHEACEQFSIRVDLSSGKWQPYDTVVPQTIPPQRTVAAFLAEFDCDFLAERQYVLRALYRRNHRELLGAIRPAAQKVGRNDPCPCGSGKKYKKCCGS